VSFLSDNASAIFGIGGLLVGGGFGFLGNWLLRKRDYDLRAWGQLLDRRVEAHEQVMAIAGQMHLMGALGMRDDEGELERCPLILRSKEVFEEWFSDSAAKITRYSPWLTTEATREFYYVLDYLTTLHQNTLSVSDDHFLELGAILRKDFVDLSAGLERAGYAFFQKDIFRLKLRKGDAWHKYPRAETERRLEATQLIKEWDAIAKLGGSAPSVGLSV
jgi:hypothetical protein